MINTNNVACKKLDEAICFYRRSFPFRMPDGAQCILFEENEELSVKIFRIKGENTDSDDTYNALTLVGNQQKEKVSVRLECQEISLNGRTRIRLFSEHCMTRSGISNGKNVYYTLQICDADSSFALFRAFSMSKEIANRLFEALCLTDVSSLHAIDYYREARAKLLHECWICGF